MPSPPYHRIGQAVTATLTAFTVALGVVFGVGGCVQPSVTRAPAPTITDPALITDAVARLCYAVNAYTVDDLDRPAVEGDIGYLAGLQGVPSDLRAAATGYWDDPRVRDLAAPANRAVADQRRGAIVAACKTKGWKVGDRATDQPPLKYPTSQPLARAPRDRTTQPDRPSQPEPHPHQADRPRHDHPQRPAPTSRAYPWRPDPHDHTKKPPQCR